MVKKVGLRRAFGILALALLVVAAALGFAACSGGNPPTETNNGSSPPGTGGSCATPSPGCPCMTPGATAMCGSQVGGSGATVMCSEGTMTCGTAGTWGACGGSVLEKRSLERHAVRPQGLSEEAGACLNDPCDPYCETFNDTPNGIDAGDGGLLVSDSGLTLAVSPNPPPTPCTGLAITPPTQTVTLTSLTFPACGTGCATGSICTNGTCFPEATFTATYTPAGCFSGPASAVWRVAPASVAQVDSTGDVSVVNPVAGPLTVTAYAGGGGDAGLVTATATLNVQIDVLDTSRAPTGQTAASFDAGASGTDGLQILYPYTNTVMPLGLLPPTAQWEPGTTGAVTSITLTSGGSGYTIPPGVVFTGGGGSGAQANATITGGIASFTLDAGGSGFSADGGTTIPVTFIGGGGSGATATATLTNAVALGTYQVTVPGQGYTSAPTVSFTGGSGSGAAATATEGSSGALTTGTFPTSASGAGYVGPVTVGFSGGGGSGATATGTLTGEVKTGTFAATTPGTGYSNGTLTITGGGGTGAAGNATFTSTGSLTTGVHTITAPGTGYTSAPTPVFSGGGTGAIGTATLATAGSVVTGTFTPSAGGTGYTSAPSVAITGGGGTGALATATVSGPVATGYTLSGGAGYTSIPTITVSGGGPGTGFAVSPTFSVTGWKSLVGGSGYNSAGPTITFPVPPSGTQAQASVTTTGVLSSVTYTHPVVNGYAGIAWALVTPTVTLSGGGYTTAGTLTTSTTTQTSGLTAVSVTAAGSGYTANCGLDITFTNGASTATATLLTSGTGTIPTTTTIKILTPGTSFASIPTGFTATGCGTGTGLGFGGYSITNYIQLNAPSVATGGAGYTTNPTIGFSNLATQSGVPTATAGVSYSVTSVTITNQGSGYTSIPVPTISGTGTGFSVTFTDSVSGLTITPGSGYTSAPTLTFSGGGGSSQATATLQLNASVASVIVSQGGSGYTSVPTVTFTGGGGSGASFTATLAYAVASINITAGGSGYTPPATVTFTGGGGSGASYTPTLTYGIASVTITAGGSGYTSVPSVNFIGGGTGATFTPTLTNGVGSITITSGGTGYTSVPTVTFVDNGGAGPGTGATYTPSLANGVLTVTVTAGGSGYTSTPTVVFSGGGGSGASFIPPMTQVVASVTITNPGSGYSSPPTPVFGGGGTGATGTTTIDGSVTGLAIVSGGSGYSSAPTVSFTGGDGSGAAATCSISSVGSSGVASSVMVSLKYPLNGSVFTYSELLPENDATYGDPYSSSPVTLGFTSGHASFSAAAWTSFTETAAGQTAYITIQRYAGGHLYPQGAVNIQFATDQLKGTVYYNTYGTQEVFNYSGIYSGSPNPSSDPNYFGAATLEIQPGQALPTPIEGYDSYNIGACTGEPNSTTGCRVCHSVNANGTLLITQDGNNNDVASHWLGLPSSESNPPCSVNSGEHTMTAAGSVVDFNFAGQYPDATMLFTNSAPLQGNNNVPSVLYSMTGTASPSAPALVTAANSSLTTLLGGSLYAGTPAFSPDGTHIAFNYQSSSGGTIGGVSGDNKSLAVVNFAAGTNTFSNARIVAKPGSTAIPVPTGGSGVSWFPTFTPDSKNVVFHYETYTNNTSWGSGRGAAETRSQCDATEPGTNNCQEEGIHSELWYSDLATKTPRRLNCLNGVVDSPDSTGHQNCPNGVAAGATYLPPNPNYSPASNAAAGNTAVPTSYAADWNLNYEPTILPQARGGYAWAVFTSRRTYGNVTSANPFWSDPRYAPIAPGSGKITPKKLWVAALDTGVTDTTHDPSHPAFYLDGQELVAGNSRGYWVLNACLAAGSATTCSSNLDCCSGAECELDNPIPAYPSLPTSHCVATPAPGACVADGASCTTNPVCCNAASGSVCSQQTNTCVVPPPLPYYQEADFVRLYTPSCAYGTRPIWQNFVYGTVTPSDSKIIIEVETSNSASTLTTTTDAGAANAAAPLIQLPIVISGATIAYPNGTQNVESALKANGDESGTYLEVIVRLIPSSDGHSAPSLTQWNQTFDCLPSQ